MSKFTYFFKKPSEKVFHLQGRSFLLFIHSQKKVLFLLLNDEYFHLSRLD